MMRTVDDAGDDDIDDDDVQGSLIYELLVKFRGFRLCHVERVW